MLRSLGNPAKFVRFRLAVSPEPVSQEEVTFIYNVFKQKTKLLNEVEQSSQLLSSHPHKPIEQVYYRHSRSKTRAVKFDRFIDIIFDLGGPIKHDTVQQEKHTRMESQIHDFKLRNLIASITRLKGILRLQTYQQLMANEGRSEIGPSFKSRPKPTHDLTEVFKSQAKLLTKASVERPFFDIEKRRKEMDYSNHLVKNLDFFKNFQVQTIRYFIGEEATALEERLIDDDSRDRLLYGFDGFARSAADSSSSMKQGE